MKKRLYVVHTSALPKDCELRVAPTGTAGTIRLDGLQPSATNSAINNKKNQRDGGKTAQLQLSNSVDENSSLDRSTEGHNKANDGQALAAQDFAASLDDGGYPSLTLTGDFIAPITPHLLATREGKVNRSGKTAAPLVWLRPTCVSDAWFILNLLSAVPFLSRYASCVTEVSLYALFNAAFNNPI